MGGVIGATSGKFVLMGAALLLHGGVDGKKVRIAIVPGAPTSAISPDVTSRMKAGGGDKEVTIHLRAESFQSRIDAVEADPAPNADLRIGQDVLTDNPIEIDFGHRGVLPLSDSEARNLKRRSRPISIRHEPDGTLSVELAEQAHKPVRAVLDLAQATEVTAPGLSAGSVVTVGGVALPNIDPTDGPNPTVGLYAFRHLRVIFDLGHDRIWVRR